MLHRVLLSCENNSTINAINRFQALFSLLLVTIALVSCSDKQQQAKQEYNPATRQLIELLSNDPEAKDLLVASIEKARQANPDKLTNPAQSLEEYYTFVSHCERSMPWALLNADEAAGIHRNTVQSMGAFYFILDQPLPELEGNGTFKNSLQYTEPFASWLVTFSKSWGSYMDSEDSWNDDVYQLLLSDSSYGLHNNWYEDASTWKTYNQFFTRRLRSPDVRPIASPEDNSVVVSFADASPQGVWLIDSVSNIISDDGVLVKSSTLKSVANLIGEESEYKDSFVNGNFTHSFLSSNDYHHFHFPISGTVKEVRLIQGSNPAGGKLWWDQENGRYAFDPSLLGWQMLETRGCVILETDDFGLVALVPVGMVAIGSVTFEENIKPGVEVKKGDLLGNFKFGGSDFIVIFQDKVNFTLDVPKNDRGGYQHILMGERLGSLSLR